MTQGGVTCQAGIEFMLQLTAFGRGFLGFVSSKVTVKSHSTEMLQREQIMRGKEH